MYNKKHYLTLFLIRLLNTTLKNWSDHDMENKETWMITEEEKEQLINVLTDELSALRAKADISQEEISKLIGISRQTYGAIERKTRKMSWNTYLSLILFFDYTKSTHKDQ